MNNFFKFQAGNFEWETQKWGAGKKEKLAQSQWSEKTRARGTSEVNLNLSEEQKVNFDPVLDGFTNYDACMLKI